MEVNKSKHLLARTYNQMAASWLDRLFQQGISSAVGHKGQSAEAIQLRQLTALLQRAQHTAFGRYYEFDQLLRKKLTGQQVYEAFKRKVPVFTYDQIAADWWNRTMAGEPDVCWPGKVPFVAISSGTSGMDRKKIPMTYDLMQSNRKGGMRQLIALPTFGLSYSTLLGETLMLGETTTLVRQENYQEGYMSSIMLNQMPFWATNRMKPEPLIRQVTDWPERMRQIVQKAPDWDIRFVSGLPSWTCLLFEQVIQHHRIKNLREIWPNLSVFAHGGLSFEPYRDVFRQYVGREITCLDSYIASEGYIACQTEPATSSLTLQLDIGIFLEFIPFNETNFDESGKPLPSHESLCIGQVTEGIDYAVVLSTPAGAWRYLLGDTIRFTDVAQHKIQVTGRTQHFINVCGEQLSMAMMLQAMQGLSAHLQLAVPEFTVLPNLAGHEVYHEWFIGVDNPITVNANEIALFLDRHLSQASLYYRESREGAVLQQPRVRVLPKDYFYRFLEKSGKLGGQHKFPRVLTGAKKEDWLAHVG